MQQDVLITATFMGHHGGANLAETYAVAPAVAMKDEFER